MNYSKSARTEVEGKGGWFWFEVGFKVKSRNTSFWGESVGEKGGAKLARSTDPTAQGRWEESCGPKQKKRRGTVK